MCTDQNGRAFAKVAIRHIAPVSDIELPVATHQQGLDLCDRGDIANCDEGILRGNRS